MIRGSVLSHFERRSRRGLLFSVALLGSVSVCIGCESTKEKDDAEAEGAGNVVLRDENNYQSTSSLSIPTVETASATDLDICWDGVLTDIQCHDVAPQTDLDNVALLRFSRLSEEEVEKKLTSGQLTQSEIGGYLEYHTDHVSTCTKLSSLAFFTTPIDIREQYVESADYTYMLLFAEGTTPGVGARAMTFVKPSATSINTRVEAPAGCGLLDFSANLLSAKPVRMPAAGPWVIDWRNVTRDGQGNPVVFESIDGVLIGFYEGMTVIDLQERIMDLELIATSLWEVSLTGGRTLDLAKARERTTGAAFSGFERSRAGVWVLGLMCGACQNPAPVVLSILEPEALGT